MSVSNHPGIEWFGGFAQNLAALVVKATESVLGVEGRNGVSGGLRSAQWIAALVFVLFFMLLDAVLFGVLRRWYRGQGEGDESATWWQVLARAVSKPLHLGVWLLGIYFSIAPLLMGWGGEPSAALQSVFGQLVNAGMLAVLIWLFFRLSLAVESGREVIMSKRFESPQGVVLPSARSRIILKCEALTH